MRQNIILITTDQQRFDTLGANGCLVAHTPNLDALAARGVNFRNHCVTNPVCSPSRASIMTGLMPNACGLWGNGCSLPGAVRTLPQAFVEADFQTAHVGKLHLVPIINRTAPHPTYGFESCEIGEGDQQLTHDDYFCDLRRKAPEVFLEYVQELYREGQSDGYASKLPEPLHHSRWVTNRACDWLRFRRDPARPFFLNVGYFDPHHAFNPCEPYASMFAQTAMAEPFFDESEFETKPPQYQGRYKAVQGTTRDANRRDRMLRAYHAMIAHLDACIGNLLETLEGLGLAGNTTIVFSSDHGEFAGEHGLLWKGPMLLDDLLRVPLMIAPAALNAMIPKGARSVETPTSSVDLMNTLLALAGADAPVSPGGKALLDASGHLFPQGARDAVFVEWDENGNGLTRSLRCVRTATHKLVRYASAPETTGELYDLVSDPHEARNRFADPSYAAVRDALLQRLQRAYGADLEQRSSTPCEAPW